MGRGRKPGSRTGWAKKTGNQGQVKAAAQVVDPINPAPVTYLRPSGRTLTWDNYLKDLSNLTKIPPVTVFANVSHFR